MKQLKLVELLNLILSKISILQGSVFSYLFINFEIIVVSKLNDYSFK